MNAAVDTFTGQPDLGLTADAALEARIDAAHRKLKRKDATDDQAHEAFSEFYRLVLQRSPTKQVALEMERRMGAR
jgi:hypothetical protein